VDSKNVNFGFLFDVDGVLTLPVNEKNPKSIIDIEIIPYLEKLIKYSYPFAFVTGRGMCWLAENLLNILPSTIKDFSCFYMEYGLLLRQKGLESITITQNDFRNIYYPKIINEIEKICLDQEIYFERDHNYCDNPAHGGLWIEEKKIMLSLGANTHISPDQVHNLIMQISFNLRNKVRIINHHLGGDILPLGWSKANATENFIEQVKLFGEIKKWYVFGDNKSDEEMCKPLKNFEFINTKFGASEVTKQKLNDIIRSWNK
jgi:hydroxymethylpyrimidine pyrophosphatase-like HAD family hydrolase